MCRYRGWDFYALKIHYLCASQPENTLNSHDIELQSAVIKFAGDSGDGMQVSGGLFTSGSALAGNDIATFPDFPAEIRAPMGTVAGVSGFQVRFGSQAIHSPGDQYDMLIAMNAAALKNNLASMKEKGIIVINTPGFDSKNLRLAGYAPTDNPIADIKNKGFQLIEVHFSKVSQEILKEEGLSQKELERGKNMVALGLACWIYRRPISTILTLTEQQFIHKNQWADRNKKLVQAGFNLGDTMEIFHERYVVRQAPMAPGQYRGISGNQAMALGFLAAGHRAGLNVFLGAYPITPASDILHEMARFKSYGVDTFMAEDEIAAITAAIGASYGGNLGITASSGPGMALKTEAIGLAVSLELPLVICNVQRGGPSTGLPTKTEQSDLFQAMFGRNGECPVPVIAASSPKDCFYAAFKAAKIALEFMTPVILLSDGYIANGAEPWKYPSIDDMPEIKPNFSPKEQEHYQPYARDHKGARFAAIPGTPGKHHRIGGLEKDALSGNISYEPLNHHAMTQWRKTKVDNVVVHAPNLSFIQGNSNSQLLLAGWGSTMGAITTAVENAIKAGYDVAQTHFHFIHPLPANTQEFLSSFQHIIIPELNTGQLAYIIKAQTGIQPITLSKVKGQPFFAKDILDFIVSHFHQTQTSNTE